MGIVGLLTLCRGAYLPWAAFISGQDEVDGVTGSREAY